MIRAEGDGIFHETANRWFGSVEAGEPAMNRLAAAVECQDQRRVLRQMQKNGGLFIGAAGVLFDDEILPRSGDREGVRRVLAFFSRSAPRRHGARHDKLLCRQFAAPFFTGAGNKRKRGSPAAQQGVLSEQPVDEFFRTRLVVFYRYRGRFPQISESTALRDYGRTRLDICFRPCRLTDRLSGVSRIPRTSFASFNGAFDLSGFYR